MLILQYLKLLLPEMYWLSGCKYRHVWDAKTNNEREVAELASSRKKGRRCVDGCSSSRLQTLPYQTIFDPLYA